MKILSSRSWKWLQLRTSRNLNFSTGALRGWIKYYITDFRYRNDKTRARQSVWLTVSSRAAVTLLLGQTWSDRGTSEPYSLGHMSRQRQLHSTLGQIRLRTGLQPTLRRNGNVHTRVVEEPHCVRALLPSFSNRSRTDSWSFGIVEDPLLHHEMQQSVTLRQSSSCDTAWSPTWRWPHLALVELAEPEQCSHSSGRYSRKSLWNDALLRAKWACCIYQ